MRAQMRIIALHKSETLVTVLHSTQQMRLLTKNNNKWSKNSDDRPHCKGDFSLEQFNVTLDCFCSWLIGTLVNSIQENTNASVNLWLVHYSRLLVRSSWRHNDQTHLLRMEAGRICCCLGVERTK